MVHVHKFFYGVYAFLTQRFRWRLVPVSPSEIKIKWAEPTGKYSHYKIRYRQVTNRCVVDESSQWLDLTTAPKGHQHKTRITGLRPDTQYEVAICDLRLRAEAQTWSNPKFCRTMFETKIQYVPELEPGNTEIVVANGQIKDSEIPRLTCSGFCGWRKYGTGQWAVKEMDVFEFERDGDDFYGAFRAVSYDKLNKRLGHMIDAE